jgi:hypothetical protein
VPYENPQRHRLNVLAATIQQAERRALFWLPLRRHCTTADLITALEHLADPDHPTSVVLDNAGFHHARLVREALTHLRHPVDSSAGSVILNLGRQSPLCGPAGCQRLLY